MDMPENVRILIETVQSNPELREKTNKLELKMQKSIDEYLADLEKAGIKVTEEEFRRGDVQAIKEAEKQDEKLAVKGKEIDKKIQEYVKEYIELASEYGLTLTEEDFKFGR